MAGDKSIIGAVRGGIADATTYVGFEVPGHEVSHAMSEVNAERAKPKPEAALAAAFKPGGPSEQSRGAAFENLWGAVNGNSDSLTFTHDKNLWGSYAEVA